MAWTPRDVVKATVVLAAFGFSAWLALAGLNANVVRIQSTFFSVSSVAFFLMVFGCISAVSCLAAFRFPRSAGIVASLAMMLIAAIQMYDLAAVYRFEFLTSILTRLVLPIVLAVVVLMLFVFEPAERRSTTDLEN